VTPRPRDPLDRVRAQARDCRRCNLWRRATQTVFGAGPADARIMFVGEEPGDREDLEGVPFVGPAGQLLRHALAEAGFDESAVYLTNAVKHFKWVERGKRRIHERPKREEILACRMWLEEEIRLVKPAAIVALGATAAGALLGPSIRVTRDRGRALTSELASFVTVTVHPSSILRARDSAERAKARAAFLRDLRAIRRRVPAGP
jgi:DNA polymerase